MRDVKRILRFLLPYPLGLLFCLSVFFFNLQLAHLVDREVIYLTFLVPVILTSRFLGFGPGIFTTGVTAFLLAYFFLLPDTSLSVSTILTYTAFYMVVAQLISTAGSWPKQKEDTLLGKIAHLNMVALKLKEREKSAYGIALREREVRKKAEADVLIRDEFMSIAAHELRTPLTTVLLQLQVTLRTILTQSLADFSGERLVKSLTVAQDQTERLKDLIQYLLNVSAVKSAIDLKLEKADLSKVVGALIERLEEQAKQQNYKISYQMSGKIFGMWDKARIEQAASNLLTNAMKFGGGKPIEVVVKKANSHALIIVKDQGIGIAPKYQKTIFDRFSRGVSDKKYKGLGVGLFVVRQIARAHKGDITVQSSPGKGSTFIMSLPIRKKGR